MRKLAALGATPCLDPIPSDLVAAKCIPPGFMVPTGWQVMVDYYQNKDTKTWVPWSKMVSPVPSIAPPRPAGSLSAEGAYGTTARGDIVILHCHLTVIDCHFLGIYTVILLSLQSFSVK